MMKTNTFRAFRNRNYALFFCGQSVSQVGTWMQRAGVSWVIYTMTHSTFMLGLTIFASQFPTFLLSLYGGILSDRYNRYKILLITQTASMIQAIVLALLTLTHHFAVWPVLALSVILGVINAFDVPARQPLVHQLVSDKADLPNALALNSSINNLARLIGPALSGLILVKFGAGTCFLLNAVSFVAVLVSLLLMKLPAYSRSPIKKKISSELLDGFRYLKQTPSIGIPILMLTLISLLVIPYDTLLPVFAKTIFKGDAVTFGYINSFIGLGALIGGLYLASLKKGTNLKIILLANTILFGFCLVLFSITRYFPLAMLFGMLGGFGMMAQSTICITILQVDTAPKMRGRVISYAAMSIFGMLPLGSLLVGAVSQRIGAAATVFCQGIIALIIAALFSGFLRGDKLNKDKAAEISEAEEVLVESA